MPKVEHKIYTEILYVYLTPTRAKWLRRVYKKFGFTTRTAFMDHMLKFFMEDAEVQWAFRETVPPKPPKKKYKYPRRK